MLILCRSAYSGGERCSRCCAMNSSCNSISRGSVDDGSSAATALVRSSAFAAISSNSALLGITVSWVMPIIHSLLFTARPGRPSEQTLAFRPLGKLRSLPSNPKCSRSVLRCSSGRSSASEPYGGSGLARRGALPDRPSWRKGRWQSIRPAAQRLASTTATVRLRWRPLRSGEQ